MTKIISEGVTPKYVIVYEPLMREIVVLRPGMKYKGKFLIGVFIYKS